MKFKVISFIKNNTSQKILSVIMALTIWYIAIDITEISENAENQINIPIIYENLSKNFYIIDNPTDSIAITYNLQKGTKNKINVSDFQVKIDLNNSKGGANFFVINEKNISKPNGVIVNRITPSHIQINLEKKIERRIAIQPRLNVNVGSDLVLEEVIINPKFVTISGPMNIIDKYQFIYTEPINITGSEAVEIVELVNLQLPKDTNFTEENQQKNVTIKIKLSNKTALKKVENIPVEIINDKYVTRFNPKTVNVLFKGDEEQLNNMSVDNIKAVIDLYQKEPGQFNVTNDIFLIKPFEIEVKKIWPPINIWILNQTKNNKSIPK